MTIGLSISALVAAVAVVLVGVRRHGRRAALVSPLAIIAFLLVGHGTVRPFVIASEPSAATTGVWQLGWEDESLTRASVILIVGFVVVGLAFALAPRSSADPAPSSPASDVSARRCLIASGIGCALWGVLFLRLGGIDVLLNDPASLKTGQFGRGYGLLGLALCLGSALLALEAWLRRPSARQLAVVLTCAGAGVVGSVCLATRGPLAVTILAALFLVARCRSVGRRGALAVGLVLLVGFCSIQVLRQVREYAQFGTVGEAVQTTMRTEPQVILSADLIEYDHLVGLVQLVPEPLDRLNGSSLLAVPGAFVPRVLWPQKPRPVDFRLSEVLYGPTTAAGTPFTVPGELWWNFGMAGVLLGCAGLGFGAGSVWWKWRLRSGTAMVASTLFGAYTYLLLTRPLGAMALTTTVAIGAVVLVGEGPRIWAAVALRARRLAAARRQLLGAAAAVQRARVPAEPLEGGSTPTRRERRRAPDEGRPWRHLRPPTEPVEGGTSATWRMSAPGE